MTDDAAREITITRIFDAPLELVFRAWTEPEMLARWWGPEGFTAPSVESDARTGGAFNLVMRGPDGSEHPITGTYREADPPERFTIESRALGPDGTPLLEAVETVTFVEIAGKTEVTLHSRAVALVPDAVQMLSGMYAGWNQSLQCLDDVLTGAVDRQIVIMRMYPASPQRVFEAWTDRAQVERWWGPDGFSLTTHEMDVRPGGTWRFTMHGPHGADYPNTIVYEEIAPAERLVYSHAAAPEADDPGFRTTLTFDEFMGQTVLTMRLVFASPEARDSTVEKYHAVDGGNQTLDRLGAMLEEAAASRAS